MSNEDMVDEKIAQLQEKVRSDVQEVGWSAMHVFAVEPDSYSFTYTIGLWPQHPEVIIVNLPHRISHAVLGELYSRVEAGDTFEAGKLYAGLLRDYDAAIQAVPDAARDEHFQWATWFHDEQNNEPPQAIQLCWPDPRGRMPWEPNYEGEACPQPVFDLA